MKVKAHLMLQGFQMAVAFLTVFPSKNGVWKESAARFSIFFFPVCGLFIGAAAVFVIYVLLAPFALPDYIIAFFIVAALLVMHGGLHLDGWMDVSDAAASWQSKEKKLEIMKDSRTGSAAVWTTVLLLGGRFLFVLFVLQTDVLAAWFLLILIPVLTRTAMGHLIIAAPLAKNNGLASWFRKESKKYDTWIVIFICALLISFLFILQSDFLAAGLFITAIVIVVYWLARYLFFSMFGGINGDMAGALCEGMETVIWLSSALYISYVMV
ncbi:adenosylcobinamide-GDP ribazoletransferase [Alteribacillus sp. YIM 98480]|uniref:adenosylcobinamide-GDP ribazoletransferase n=1 Tax=Alteribacillus sp. YIM 98480 TaxID=2606599 RepID=UPI00131AA9A2|nr:adenosylcobinamide-GDP ribazoletransferase [Alteribacillus sp. YIM 98480]